ncbi:MAG: hypothetical protein QOC70_902 [Verrucomicrobiota bacterium]
MKNLSRGLFLAVVLFTVTVAFGGVPPLNVTVANGGGKASFKGVTDSKGFFATANLQPGSYTVQFVSNSAAVKGNNYSIVVSAGKKKVSAGPVSGEKFTKGGVAMKVDVGPGLNITGQVVTAMSGPVKDGKKMVWIQPQLGSHMPGHWAEEGSAEAMEAKTSTMRSSEGGGKTLQDRH